MSDEAAARAEELADDEEVAAESAEEDDEDGSSDHSLTSAVTGRLGRVVRSERTAGIVASLEDSIWKFRRERKVGKGTLRATHVVGYRGFVADGRAYARVRVTEEPVVPKQAEALSDPEVIRANLRKFAALSFPG